VVVINKTLSLELQFRHASLLLLAPPRVKILFYRLSTYLAPHLTTCLVGDPNVTIARPRFVRHEFATILGTE